MRLKLKESKIYNWWLAHDNYKMEFADVSKIRGKKLCIVGYQKENHSLIAPELITSPDHVKRITRKGVVTQSGVLYPFTEAHALYLRFLVDKYDPKNLIVVKWEFIKTDATIIGDIMQAGEIKLGVKFDFIPDKSTDILYKGYSKKLNSSVILMPFDKKGIPNDFIISNNNKADIYNSSFIGTEEKNNLLHDVERIIKSKS